EVYDAYRDEVFTLKVALMWTINDFLAYGNLAGCSVKGYRACPICGNNTNSYRLKHGRKMCYMNHRKWLPRDHLYRKKKKAFNGQQENGIPRRQLIEVKVKK